MIEFPKEIDSSIHEVDFKLGYLNIQGYSNKSLVLNEFLIENRFDVVCLSEHWSKKDEIVFNTLDDFQLVSSYCREQHIHGGVSIYIRNCSIIPFKASELDLSSFLSEINFEVSGVCIEVFKLVVIVIYRSPKGDESLFLEKLECMLNFFSSSHWKKYKIVLGGDLNSSFDVNEPQKQSVVSFKNLLRQFNFELANRKPTRGRACLDNIFTNLDRTNIVSEVTPFHYSDHECVWIGIKKLRVGNNNSKDFKVITSRPISKEKIDSCRYSLCNFDWKNFVGSFNIVQPILFLKNFFMYF